MSCPDPLFMSPELWPPQREALSHTALYPQLKCLLLSLRRLHLLFPKPPLRVPCLKMIRKGQGPDRVAGAEVTRRGRGKLNIIKVTKKLLRQLRGSGRYTGESKSGIGNKWWSWRSRESDSLKNWNAMGCQAFTTLSCIQGCKNCTFYWLLFNYLLQRIAILLYVFSLHIGVWLYGYRFMHENSYIAPFSTLFISFVLNVFRF